MVLGCRLVSGAQGTPMAKASRSGITVTKSDVSIILGMVNRGDRRHDIAAWFGLNQGRVAEVEAGDHGAATPAPMSQLPPSGSPGPKARQLRRAADTVHQALQNGDVQGAIDRLNKAMGDFDKNE